MAASYRKVGCYTMPPAWRPLWSKNLSVRGPVRCTLLDKSNAGPIERRHRYGQATYLASPVVTHRDPVGGRSLRLRRSVRCSHFVGGKHLVVYRDVSGFAFDSSILPAPSTASGCLGAVYGL